MELILVSLVITVVAPFLFLPLIMLLSTRNKSNTLNFPPGNTGWPIIGETLEFLNSRSRGVPEKFFHDRMQKFSSQIFRTSLLGKPAAVLCGPTGNKFIYSNENKLVQPWWPSTVYKILPSLGETVFNKEATRLRKMLPGFFKPEALQRYVETMDTIAKQHLQNYWENRKDVKVFPLSKGYTFAVACKLFMSIDDPIHLARLADPFATLVSGFMAIPINLPGTLFNKAIKASVLFRKDLEKIIKQRKIDLAEKRAFPMQDILSHMLLTSDENGKFMTEMDIADRILGLLIAGNDPTSATITFVIKFLAELPHIYNEVLREQMKILKSKGSRDFLNWEDIQKMKYSWNVACEVMRLVPPSQGSFREVLADFTYNGFSIPKGWKLYWSTDSIHKNPTYFPNPEKFDPSRYDGDGPAPYTYVPFGGGPRMCPGKEYARLEILVFMHNVVTKFKWEKIFPDEKIVVNLTPIPAKGLPIRLEPQVC